MTMNFNEVMEAVNEELEKSVIHDPYIMVVEVEGSGYYTHDPDTYDFKIIVGNDVEKMKTEAQQFIDEVERGVWTVEYVTLMKMSWSVTDIYDYSKNRFKEEVRNVNDV